MGKIEVMLDFDTYHNGDLLNLRELLVNNKKIEMPVESPLPEKEVKKNHYHVKINLIFLLN